MCQVGNFCFPYWQRHMSESDKYLSLAFLPSFSLLSSGLPPDISTEEFVELMSKCGIVMRDPITDEYKVKLYKDRDGNLKGDGLCCYLKVSRIFFLPHVNASLCLQGSAWNTICKLYSTWDLIPGKSGFSNLLLDLWRPCFLLTRALRNSNWRKLTLTSILKCIWTHCISELVATQHHQLQLCWKDVEPDAFFSVWQQKRR